MIKKWVICIHILLSRTRKTRMKTNIKGKSGALESDSRTNEHEYKAEYKFVSLKKLRKIRILFKDILTF